MYLITQTCKHEDGRYWGEVVDRDTDDVIAATPLYMKRAEADAAADDLLADESNKLG